MEKMHEFEHMGCKVSAPHSLVVESVLERLRGQRFMPVFCSVGEVSSDRPALGEAWASEGGIRAAEIRGEDGRIYDLVVVTGDNGTPIVFKDEQWGEYGEEVEGADSLRDGFANTTALIKAGNTLAKKIANCGAPDHADCYWPAICEVNAVFINLAHLFDKKYHWSSTQAGASSARCQGFESGDSGWLSKTSGSMPSSSAGSTGNSVLH